MDQHDLLAERFETHRARLRAIAYQMLGSAGEADDALQEAWLRLSRTDPGSRTSRDTPARISRDWHDGTGPENEALLADSLGPALLVILHTLAPAERLAFVLHDMFAVPFDDIAPIVGRSPAAARQLASRGRRRSRAWLRSPAPI